MRISVGREKNGSRAAEQSPKKKGESNGKTFDSAIETLLKRNWMMNQQQTNFVFSSRASMTIAIKNLIYGSFDSDLLLFFFGPWDCFVAGRCNPVNLSEFQCRIIIKCTLNLWTIRNQSQQFTCEWRTNRFIAIKPFAFMKRKLETISFGRPTTDWWKQNVKHSDDSNIRSIDESTKCQHRNRFSGKISTTSSLCSIWMCPH